jgi:ectoine hydroxylase-related dioxygenase (phytanoyl-CoA dioxygenase family)
LTNDIQRLDERASTVDALTALARDGVVVLERALPVEVLARADDELAPWLSRPVEESPVSRNAFTGMSTLRTSALIAKSRACGELAMAPRVLELVDGVLGPQCARFQLSFTQAIAIGPGERPQALHRDTSMYPLKRPGPEVFVNAIWALSDFTADNGATRFLVGSHGWPEGRRPSRDDRQVAAEMARGSAVVYLGSCFHGGGGNRTADSRRIGIAFGYTLGWLRQEENQYLAVPPEVARRLPIDLQRLIGYAEHHPFIGWHEGQDDELFRGGRQRKQYATQIEGGESLALKTILDPTD